MRRQTYVFRILQVLVPVLFLVAFYGVRFKRLPEWSRDVYPFVLWPLFAVVIVLAVVYLVDTRMGQGSPFVLWAWLAMSIAFAVFYYFDATTGQAPWFIALPLVALVLILSIATFWRFPYW